MPGEPTVPASAAVAVKAAAQREESRERFKMATISRGIPLSRTVVLSFDTVTIDMHLRDVDCVAFGKQSGQPCRAMPLMLFSGVCRHEACHAA